MLVESGLRKPCLYRKLTKRRAKDWKHGMRTIDTVSDVEEGARYLARVEPRFAHAREVAGPLPLRRREEGFAALLDMIVSQQVSVAAADSIWSRIRAAGLDDPNNLNRATDEEIRACGLSRQKASYARALCTCGIDFAALRDLPDEEVVLRLTEVKGIGRWTGEIYAMFSLGRPDVIAAGDLALQEAAKLLFDLENRPTEGELRTMAQAWKPWRSVGARLLWAYYRKAKDREGVR